MRSTLAFITGTRAVSEVTGRADDETQLVPLGFDPRLGLIHLVETRGERPTQRFVVAIAGRERGRLVAVRNPPERGADAWLRLRALTADLVPLVRVGRGLLRMRTRVARHRALRVAGGDAIRTYTLKLTLSPAGVAGRPDAHLVTSYLRPRAHLRAVYVVLGADLALALVARLGVPFDIGHEIDCAFLVALPRGVIIPGTGRSPAGTAP